MPDEGSIRSLFAVSTMHGVVAPRAVVVRRDERTGGIQKGNDVALRVEDVVVELRCLAVLVDHGERLVAVVVHELEGLHRLVNRIVAVARLPLLAHDLAGERGIGIGRRALVGGRVDLLAAADAGHVVGVRNLLAVHCCGGELAALRPREGILFPVIVPERIPGNRVAGYNAVIRTRLPLVLDGFRGTAGCHAREQIGPRGVRVTKGLGDRAVFRDAADIARRIVGIEEGRLAAVLLRHQLALRVVGILLPLGRLGHARAIGHDLGDVAGVIVGIGEAAAARAERVARARQTRAHPVAAVNRDAVVGIGAVIDLGLRPVLVGHRDALGRQLAQVIVAIRGRDHALARDRGRDGADRAVDRAIGRAVGLDAGVGILLVVQARAELPRLGRHAVGSVVHVLRGLDERAGARRLARMDEPAEAVVLVAVLLRDLAVTARGILPREGIVTAVVVVVRSNVFLLMRRPVDVIIRGGALPVKRVVGVADAVFVAVSHFRQTAVIDVALIFVSREGDGRCVSRALRARGADLHARHVAEGVVAQQVVLPEGVDVVSAGIRRLRERLADEVGQLRAVVVIVDGGRAADVRIGSAVAARIVPVLLLCAVGRRGPEQVRGRTVVPVLRRDAVGIRGLRAEAARAVNREIKCGRCISTARLHYDSCSIAV